MAGGVAEQDRRRQGGGEEDVSVILGVLRCGWGVACRLMETEEEQLSRGGEADLECPSATLTVPCSGRFLRTAHPLPLRLLSVQKNEPQSTALHFSNNTHQQYQSLSHKK